MFVFVFLVISDERSLEDWMGFENREDSIEYFQMGSSTFYPYRIDLSIRYRRHFFQSPDFCLAVSKCSRYLWVEIYWIVMHYIYRVLEKY